MDGEPGDTPNLFPVKVGEKLRDARLAAGLELADIAGRTRVPQRHLAAIEASDYSGLPSPHLCRRLRKSLCPRGRGGRGGAGPRAA
ncbi:helix-turn-helix domain-containing protein [Sphingomonas sp. J315]|uniref:helix-turn-helix domain-containing protein n=1 Tax=Sphingomonas sp. J315 TaxID=2898433 RepID=UPI003916FA80